MNGNAIEKSYLATIDQLRGTLAEKRKWTEMPDLLDELHRLRSSALAPSPMVGSPGEALSRSAWMTRFGEAVLVRRIEGEVEAVDLDANLLWHWVGHVPPEALAEGSWESLPRNYPEARTPEL